MSGRSVSLAPCSAAAQRGARSPPRRRPSRRAQLQAAIDKLGDLDYATRTTASRTVRRTPAAQAVPALMQAVVRACRRLRALSRARPADRLQRSAHEGRDARVARQPERSAARPWPTASSSTIPIRAMVPQLLDALDKEQAEFVRPGAGPRARRGAGARRRCRACAAGAACARSAAARTSSAAPSSRRSATTRRAYAFDALTAVAKLDGPLQDDAALALGKIGDKRALETLAGAAADRAARRRSRRLPPRSACSASTATSHESYLVETLKFADKNRGLSGAAARRRRRPRRAGGRRPRGGRATRCSTSACPSTRSDARARRAGAGDGRAAQHAADADAAREARRPRRARSRCWPKASTCSRRISTRSASSPSSAAAYWAVARRLADAAR